MLGDVNPGASIQVMPPFADTCHCTVGVGVPLAAAVKVTVLPELTDWLIGWVVMTGAMAGITVMVAALVVADPTELVNTARSSQPFTKGVGTPLMLGDVTPGASIQVVPPSADTCHWTVGVGAPLAAAVNVTVPPWLTVWLIGWVVMTGAVAGVTVSAAELLVADPDPLVNTASYSLPFSASVVPAMVSVSAVAPDTGVKVAP
jgi:hypothetical protein